MLADNVEGLTVGWDEDAVHRDRQCPRQYAEGSIGANELEWDGRGADSMTGLFGRFIYTSTMPVTKSGDPDAGIDEAQLDQLCPWLPKVETSAHRCGQYRRNRQYAGQRHRGNASANVLDGRAVWTPRWRARGR